MPPIPSSALQKRKRYNEKGRAASLQRDAAAAEGRHHKRKREYDIGQDDEAAAYGALSSAGAIGGGNGGLDGGLDLIDPVERKRQKQEAAAARLAAKNAAANQISSKKQKKMDAYVKRKLKKEDRKELIASLAKTQTTNLSLQSSSALGSKQFATQEDKLSHMAELEAGRRERAKGLVSKLKGRGHLSDGESEGDDDEDAEMADGTAPLGRELVPEPALTSHRNATTLNSKAAPAFNASGSLGVVINTPAASTSTSAASPKKAGPLPTPASIPAVVGSGLSAGTKIQVVKRALKQKGRMRELAGLAAKGKAKAVEAEEESSEFDSSDATEEDDDDEDDASGAEEEWAGIGGDEDGAVDGEDEEEEEGSGSGSGEGEEGESDDESEEDESAPPQARRAKGAFTAWADTQTLNAAGLTTSLIPDSGNSHPSDAYVPLLPAGSGFKNAPMADGVTGPLGAPLTGDQLPTLPPQRVTHVPIVRTEEMQKQRDELPIVKEEDRIMDAVRNHPVIVLCGETGSGKTTQIGQFLWEAGWGDKSSDNPGMVAITQPRRVAALSTCARVRAELCLPEDSSLVAHRIRYSSNTSPDTKLVFMTDGVLLRELAADFLLNKYSLVVIDEAHERGVNTDVLIGVLSRVAKLRETLWREGKEGAKPLRLVIMSATLRVSDFSENSTLFPTPPPVLSVTARQHPVTTHFARRTSASYLEQAYKKVARIHAQLPPGGVLVFCTGQNEIVSLVKKLEKKFGSKAIKERKAKAELAAAKEKARREGRADKKLLREKEKAVLEGRDVESEEEEDWGVGSKGVEAGDDLEAEEIELGEDKDLAADVDDGIPEEDDPEDLESSDDEGDDTLKGMDLEADTDEPMYVLPLYSLLPTEKQMKVFAEPPPGHRLVVVATNVAETSITIPNIKYVVDAGRAKERQFDVNSGIQAFEVGWISKAAAAQRAGRAGRTGPGHCYRLYSSAVFENYFDQHSQPEILRMPIEGIILQMKSMNIDAVANFPFPTPPDREALRRAEKTLVHLGALEASTGARGTGGKITELGRSMALFPLSPRFSKMIVAGQQHGCLPYVIAVVCALSVGDPFIRETNLGDEEEDVPDMANEKALTAAEIRHIRDPEIRAREEIKVARKSFFEVQSRYAALGKSASDVFKMLSVVGAYEWAGATDAFCAANFVRPKAMQEIHKLRAQISRIVQSTYPGIDAGFVPKLNPPNETQLKVIRQLLTSAFIDQVAVRKDLFPGWTGPSYSKVASTRGVPYRAFGINEDIFIHPSSVLFHHQPAEFLVFQDLHRTNKVWLKTLTKINSAWLPTLGKPLCTFSKPLDQPVSAAAAAKLQSTKPDERQVFLTPRFGVGDGIELKPVLVSQKLVNGRWVFA